MFTPCLNFGVPAPLASDIVKNNNGMDEEEINFLVQRLLNRIIFLRICEDREIEKYETLKKVKNYNELKELFKKSDKKYNSGLFDFIEDNFSLKIKLNDQILIGIFEELYYPASPYDFSVIEPNILSQIYEKYLANKIILHSDKTVGIEEEPEVVASNGVIPTPKIIVDQIIQRALDPVMARKGKDWIDNLHVADICCGSGTFLISLFDYLSEKRIEQLSSQDDPDEAMVIPSNDKTWHLTLRAKQELAVKTIFGVDINPYAAEVTRFSILLKLLEEESSGSIEYYLATYKEKVLPDLGENIKCGNSLVDDRYLEFNKSAVEDDNLLNSLKIFNWNNEFPVIEETGGFDAIVGNPPYVRIQNLVKYSESEIKYYQSKISPFTVGAKDIFDKYYLFIERALQLTNEKGIVGYIVPHKFFIIKGGKKLRSVITSSSNLCWITHFGVTQVFPGRSTYTAILILDKNPSMKLKFQRISKLTEDELANAQVLDYESSDYGSDPWTFLSKDATSLFKRIRSGKTVPLKDISEISVGLQTSADKIYIIKPDKETKGEVHFSQGGKEWKIEKGILLPSIYDAQFGLFGKPKANSKIIFPYKIEKGKAVLYSEKEMESKFPLCWKYLKSHKRTLKKRDIGGGKVVKWYQYGRSQSLTKFHDTKKLIWPVLSTGPNYALDDGNLQFTGGGNGPYYSILPGKRYSIYYILAIISHPVFESLVKSRASEFRGAYYSHGKQFIANLPIRRIAWNSKKDRTAHDKIVESAKAAVEAKVNLDEAKLPEKRKVLKQKLAIRQRAVIKAVNDLYKITEDDLGSISGSKLFIADT